LESFEKLGKIWEILRKLREYWKIIENIAKLEGKVGIFSIYEKIYPYLRKFQTGPSEF
jgi:hypothetical protein